MHIVLGKSATGWQEKEKQDKNKPYT